MSVPGCSLFNGRLFQYGPALAYASKNRRFLVYYPLGSGKTLSSIHAARVFLDSCPSGKIVVVTTLSNVETTWKKAIKMYRKASGNIHKRAFRNSLIHNIDWWFSQQNETVASYNVVLQYLSEKGHSRQTTQTLLPRELLSLIDNKKMRRQFRESLLPSQKKISMVQASMPSEPFCLIVDECQEYIGLSSKSEFVNALADKSACTILLSATPVHDSYRYSGLKRLLGNPRNVKKSILWTNFSEDMPSKDDNYVMEVGMNDEEWRIHQAAVRSTNSAGNLQNAYLTKSRQKCNCDSKWVSMAETIESDIASSDSIVRIVVYSFFLGRGVDGFFTFLKNRWNGTIHKKKLVHKIRDVDIKCSKMHDNTLKWFNNDSDTAKILLLTSRSGVGISLKNVKWFHLMEPQWSAAEDQQAVGRATRKGSHTVVEPEVKVYRWISKSPKYGKTADERVRAQMLEKKKRTDRLLNKLATCGKKYLDELLEPFDSGIYSI